MKYEYKKHIYALGRLHRLLGLTMKELKKSNLAEAVKLLDVCQSKLAEIEGELLPLVRTEGIAKREDSQ